MKHHITLRMYLFPLKVERSVSEQHNVLNKLPPTKVLNILNIVQLQALIEEVCRYPLGPKVTY